MKIRYDLALTVAAILWLGSGLPASARDQGPACGTPQQRTATMHDRLVDSAIARLEIECPLLGRIVEEFALRDLGEIAANHVSEAVSRDIAVVAVVAGSGDVRSIKRHAEHALQTGATRFELREILYLTALYAGIPTAIEATRALSDLLNVDENEI